MDFIHTFAGSDLFDLKASNSITYEGTITSGANITLDGGGGVLLNPGTTVQVGATLKIQTTGCTP